MRNKLHWIVFSWGDFEELVKGKVNMKELKIPIVPKEAQIISIEWERCTDCLEIFSRHTPFCKGQVIINYIDGNSVMLKKNLR